MSNLDPSIPDAKRGNWVERFLPPAFVGYAQLARLDRPIGWWLLLWPCWWSLALASGAAGESYPDPKYVFLLFIGSVVMRGAGCTYNDIVDRDIDARVARTRNRPIPAGRVSVRAAMVFMIVQALIGFLVLIQFNLFTIGLGIASLLVVSIYPFMKRVTGYPQAVLGLAFSWGALVGWSAVHEGLHLAPISLYLAAVFWTVGYDTIYAHQDREDDALVGLSSTALTLGEQTPVFLGICYITTVILVAFALYLAGSGLFAYVGLAAFALHLGWQIARFNMKDPDLCLVVFKSNREAGWLLFVAFLVDGAIRALP